MADGQGVHRARATKPAAAAVGDVVAQVDLAAVGRVGVAVREAFAAHAPSTRTRFAHTERVGEGASCRDRRRSGWRRCAGRPRSRWSGRRRSRRSFRGTRAPRTGPRRIGCRRARDRSDGRRRRSGRRRSAGAGMCIVEQGAGLSRTVDATQTGGGPAGGGGRPGGGEARPPRGGGGGGDAHGSGIRDGGGGGRTRAGGRKAGRRWRRVRNRAVLKPRRPRAVASTGQTAAPPKRTRRRPTAPTSVPRLTAPSAVAAGSPRSSRALPAPAPRAAGRAGGSCGRSGRSRPRRR